MPKLEPCPFCGGEVEIWKYSKRALALQKAVSHAPTMFSCKKCGAKTSFDNPFVNAADSHGFKTEAIRAWNKRRN